MIEKESETGLLVKFLAPGVDTDSRVRKCIVLQSFIYSVTKQCTYFGGRAASLQIRDHSASVFLHGISKILFDMKCAVERTKNNTYT